MDLAAYDKKKKINKKKILSISEEAKINLDFQQTIIPKIKNRN